MCVNDANRIHAPSSDHGKNNINLKTSYVLKKTS